MPALAIALAFQPVEPPRGVNNEILGTAEEFRTAGPARICLVGTSIDLLAGETAYLDYLGIHWRGVRVVAPEGAYRVREGTWAEPRTRGKPVGMSKGRKVMRHPSPEGPRYLIYGRSEDSGGAYYPSVWLEGDALMGTARDRKILHRINVNETDLASCQRRFVDGWDFGLEGGESE